MLKEKKKEKKYGKVIKCAFCKSSFKESECDKDFVGSVAIYYCPSCGEEMCDNLHVK